MSKKKKGDNGGWKNLSHIVHHLIGEICCVTRTIKEENVGYVRIYGSDFPAAAKVKVKRGRWVRVVSHNEGILNVTPLNAWLGSCCH